MVAKPAVYRNREKLGTKTAPFAAFVKYNFGRLGCVVVLCLSLELVGCMELLFA